MQFIFFTLFIFTLLAGLFVYTKPAQKAQDPLKSLIGDNRDDLQEVSGHQRVEESKISTSQGHTTINTQAQESSLLQGHAPEAGMGDKDILKLKSLAQGLRDTRHLDVANGQALISMNDQLVQKRRKEAGDVDLMNMNHGPSNVQDTIDEEQQKAQEQREENQQRAEDQKQRLLDQQEMQNR